MSVRAKKHLGQHFLKDKSICSRIVNAIPHGSVKQVLEVGPGMGALTEFLLQRDDFTTHVIEVDTESIEYLEKNFTQLKGHIYNQDFLKINPTKFFGEESFAVVGNFPYNISSQILFKVLDHKNQIPFVIGMFQKEVAERIAEKPGTKKYGITSVLLQAFYDIEYLFTVEPEVFIPPPKVKSGVIMLKRNNIDQLPCDEKLFKLIVKTSFNQRRKTLRNSLKSMLLQSSNPINKEDDFFSRRPETLSVNEFIELTQQFQV